MARRSEASQPPNLTCLKNVDSLLRCPICFDFLSIAMMTKCSHNFCSLCIRKFLCLKLLCPVCNLQTTEQDLRNNRILDDLVTNFKAARQETSKVKLDSPPPSPATHASAIHASAIQCRTATARGPTRDGSILSHFFQVGHKTAKDAKEAQQTGSALCVSRRKMQPACTRTSNNANLHKSTVPRLLDVKQESEEETVSPSDLVSVKVEETELSSAVPQTSKAFPVMVLEDVKPVIKVECPVCSVGVSQQFINKHLDSCLSRGEKKESLRSSLGGRRRSMGKLVYNLLSMPELKRKLKECHLSVQGSRDQLVKRHQEFVHIYNAQCDSLSPISAEDIAKEVEANEKIKSQLQGKSRRVFVFSKNQSEGEIDEMHSNYRKQHSTEFSFLIAEVRGRLESKGQSRSKREVKEQGEEAQGASIEATESKASEKECRSTMLEETLVEEPASAGELPGPTSPSDSVMSISRDVTKTSVQIGVSTSEEGSLCPRLRRAKRRRKT